MWTKRTLTCACSPLLLWSWYSRKFQFVRENVRHTCKKRERREQGTHSRTSRWNDLGDWVFEWNIEHSQIQNKKSTLQSLKSHKHPGRGGPYRKPQKSWKKKKKPNPTRQSRRPGSSPRLATWKHCGVTWLRITACPISRGTVMESCHKPGRQTCPVRTSVICFPKWTPPLSAVNSLFSSITQNKY